MNSIKDSMRRLSSGLSATLSTSPPVNNNNNIVDTTTPSFFSRFRQMGNNPSSSFVNSNSIVTKFVFLILIFIVFLFLCNLGISLIGYGLQKSKSPYLVKGKIDGTNALVISQDPSNTNSVSITRSNDERSGMEFSWAVWLLLTDNSVKNTYQNIFNKGDTNYVNGISQVNNAPGLYLSSLVNNENKLHIIMDTVDPSVGPSKIDIGGVPFNKWFLVVIRLENKVLDVYINGTITSRNNMKSVPKQNYNNVNICQNGGFKGQLSNLRYYDYALSSFTINRILLSGPDLSTSVLDSAINKKSVSPYFLSSTWYSNQD